MALANPPALRAPLSQSLLLHKSVDTVRHLQSSSAAVATPYRRSRRFSSEISAAVSYDEGCHSFVRSRKKHLHQHGGLDFRARASEVEQRCPSEDGRIGGGSAVEIAVGSAATVVLSVVNRVLYKLALVPMKEYPFFMAQLTTFGYVAIYFSILYARYHTGIVTKEMMGIPKRLFLAIGMLEALGLAAGMAAGAMLPGPAIPILNQTFLVWQLIFSSLILGSKFSFSQTFGCLLVAAGVVLAVSSGANQTSSLSEIGFLWPSLMIGSSAFSAAASIIKEFVFVDASKRLEGKPLDIFVVNSFGSGFQALFVLLFLPFLSNMKGIPFSELPSYLRDGTGCFLNIGANITGCDGAPLLPLLYIAVNMAFNISILHLVKISSAVVSSLAATLSVPIAIYVLTLPLPYLPEGDSLSSFFIIGSAILVLGLVLYNLPQPANKRS